jgi:hypothetical protein
MVHATAEREVSLASEGQNKPNSESMVVGRTPWDAGVALIGALGRAVPFFAIVAMAVYAIIEVSKADQRARSDVVQEYATRVEKLIALQETGFAQYEQLRTGQIDTLNKLSVLTNSIISSISDNQQKISEAQKAVEEERTRLADAQDKLRTALQKVADAQAQLALQQKSAGELEQKLIQSEARIDLAYRITEYVAAGGLDRLPPVTRTALSETFEATPADAARVDSAGNRYYGVFRLTGREMEKFIDFCKARFPEIANALAQAGGGQAALDGDEKFRQAWERLTQIEKFRSAQETYMLTTFYRPLANAVKIKLAEMGSANGGEDLLRLKTVQAIVWSVAIQHGRRDDLFDGALLRLDGNPLTPENFINAVYDEREQIGKYFPNETADTQRVLKARYVFERRTALAMLKEETSNQTPREER